MVKKIDSKLNIYELIEALTWFFFAFWCYYVRHWVIYSFFIRSFRCYTFVLPSLYWSGSRLVPSKMAFVACSGVMPSFTPLAYKILYLMNEQWMERLIRTHNYNYNYIHIQIKILQQRYDNKIIHNYSTTYIKKQETKKWVYEEIKVPWLAFPISYLAYFDWTSQIFNSLSKSTK